MKTNTKAKTTTSRIAILQATEVLESMTRDEIRNLATHLGVKRGKDKKNTVQNILAAFRLGTARIKVFATISAAPAAGTTYGKTLYVKKFRSYKEDKLIQAVPPIPLSVASPVS